MFFLRKLSNKRFYKHVQKNNINLETIRKFSYTN